MLALEPDGGSGALAVSIDGNGRRVACDPYTGAVEAVLECARNLACVGAEPLGLTNCLNFGNPEKPHIAWQLTRAVEGMRDACLALGVPVVGGNVSLYNEGGGGPIYPTPIVGMVGKLPDPSARAAHRASRRRATRSRSSGTFEPALDGSELEKLRGRLAELAAARSTWPRRPTRWSGCATAVRERRAADGARHRVRAAWRCALAECCIAGGLGAVVSLSDRARDPERELFGEGPGGVIVAGPRGTSSRRLARAVVIGEVARRRARDRRRAQRARRRAARRLRGRDPLGVGGLEPLLPSTP